MPEDEVISLTLDDINKQSPPKDWQDEYFERKGKPVWEEVLTINGQEIKVSNYDQEFVLTGGHKEDINQAIVGLQVLNPRVTPLLHQIIFSDQQPVSRYNDEEKYPFNGTTLNKGNGIMLFRSAQNREIEHRTGVTNRFAGTVTHETLHLRNDYVQAAWKKRFGWVWCADYPEEWEIDPEVRIFKNKKTGQFSPNGQFTTHPETCVTDYARLAWDDDYADSGVVAVYQPDKLQELAPDKLEALKQL